MGDPKKQRGAAREKISLSKISAAEARRGAIEIVRALREAGHEAYWVGGCVRDMLLGKIPVDYDIASDAKPAEVEALFPRTIPVGRQFGVVIVLQRGAQFQVATFRAEADYQDGRRPGKVSFSHARADAIRRDFTINGLFYDPLTEQIHDWVGGRADLRARQLRTIGDPRERFGEDHLRILRAVRFAAQLDFAIAPETLAAARELAAKVQLVSAERIREELNKLFRPPHAARGLQLLETSGLLAQVLPEIAATITCDQSPDFHPEGSVFNHLVKMLSLLPADAAPSLPWAVLMHDIAKPVTAARDAATGRITFYGHETIGADMARTILGRLRFPKRQIEEVATTVRYHMQFKDARQMRPATVRRMILRPTFPLELELHRLDCLGSSGHLESYEFLVEQTRLLHQKPAVRKPLLTGEDLLSLGMKSGPAVGKLLAEARELQLGDELKTRRAALAWARGQARAANDLTSGGPAHKPVG